MKSVCSRERGGATVVAALLGVLLLGFMGLALDTSRVWTASQELQVAADAAAMAAAAQVKLDPDLATYDTTRQTALKMAQSNDAAAASVKIHPNHGNAPDGDVVVGFWDFNTKSFIPDLAMPNAVKVTARRTTSSQNGSLNLLFGPLFGADSAEVVETAVAVSAPSDPWILVLDPNRAGALRLNGTAVMEVPSGKVQVNSTSGCAVQMVGTTMLDTPTLSTSGAVCVSDLLSVSGKIEENADPVPDPLAHLLPNGGAWNSFTASLAQPLGAAGAIDRSGTFSAGYYPGGIDLNSGHVVNLEPGSYVLGGRGIDLKGSSKVYGYGVTLFIDQGSRVDVSGSEAGFEISAPTAGPFAGIAVFHHPQNTMPKAAKFSGGGELHVSGTVYIRNGGMDMGGTPGKRIGRIIVDTLEVSGVTGYLITGVGVAPWAGNDYVYLVQ